MKNGFLMQYPCLAHSLHRSCSFRHPLFPQNPQLLEHADIIKSHISMLSNSLLCKIEGKLSLFLITCSMKGKALPPTSHAPFLAQSLHISVISSQSYPGYIGYTESLCTSSFLLQQTFTIFSFGVPATNSGFET